MKSKTYFTRMHSHGQLPCKSKLKSKLQYQCLQNRCWSLDVLVDVLVNAFECHWTIFWNPLDDILEEIPKRNYKVQGKQSENGSSVVYKCCADRRCSR